MNPDCKARILINIFLIIFLTLMTWYIPIYISFELELNKGKNYDLTGLKAFIFIIYLFESIINLFTGFTDKGEVNMNKKDVIKNFIKNHFVFDVITLASI